MSQIFQANAPAANMADFVQALPIAEEGTETPAGAKSFQRQQLGIISSSVKSKYPEWSGLQQMFESKAAEIPEETAVEFPRKDVGILFERQLTYRELNFRANQLARHLQKLGVGPDIIVGISAERSIEMVIGALAVIKAGGAYAPLDPTYPQERVSYMIEDTRAPVILTQQKFAAQFQATKAHVFCLDTDWKKISGESGDNLPCCVTPDHLAYLIYTSGSTGKPKGVAMRQGPLINLLCWQMENWSGPAKARTLQFASMNFDVSFQELFATWCSGGTLVLITEDERRDPRLLARFIQDNQVQRLFLPFGALKHLA
ncbi:MAG: non-ribosomal peptide synthetase, partial [Verrucomicrobiales bacterium]|nr:non-ribosomal peptide synthetase [Verrucomicrobiales bacterium]